MIINNAQNYGLAQLYQLRGRVGRSERKAFCYLAYKGGTNKEGEKKVKPHVERLETLVKNQDLGAGFRIASKDLEMRGAGSYLGEKQHGNIVGVGYALYIEMLAQEMGRLEKVEKEQKKVLGSE